MYTDIREIKRKLADKLLIFFVAFPVIVKLTLLVDPVRVGCDTWTHLYKAHVLKKQMQMLPIGIWGSWDWSWHVGYEFLDVYSPLPYYCIVFPSIGGLTLEMSLSILIASCILIGAFGVFYLCRKITQNNNDLSLLSVALFLYSPTFVIVLIEWGNIGKFIVYTLAPTSLLLAKKLAESNEKVQMAKYGFLLGILIALSFLSNTAVGLWVLIMSAAWIMFESHFFDFWSTAKILGMTMVSFLLCAHFLLPMIYSRATFLPVISPTKLDISSLKDVLLKMSVLYWIFIGILLIVLLRCPRKKIDKNFKFFLGFLLLYLLYNLTAIVTEDFLPSLSLIRGDRSFVVILTLGSMLPPYLLKMLDIKRKTQKIISLIFMGVFIIQGLLTAPYYPLQYRKYFDAAKFIALDPKWCRYAFLPREPIGAVLPQYANKPYVDGWSFLSDPEIFSILGTAVPGYERIEKTIIENCTAGLKILAYLGVKYIIVDKNDPIYGYEFSSAIYNSISTSRLAIPRYMQESVTVFEVRNFSPLHVYSEVPKSFDAAISQALPFDGKMVIIQMTQTEQELRLDLRASGNLYVVIPVVNSDKLETYVNGEKTETFHAFGNLIAIFLPRFGEYSISVKLKTWQPIRVFGALISTITLVVGSVYVVFASWRSKRERNSFR